MVVSAATMSEWVSVPYFILSLGRPVSAERLVC